MQVSKDAARLEHFLQRCSVLDKVVEHLAAYTDNTVHNLYKIWQISHPLPAWQHILFCAWNGIGRSLDISVAGARSSRLNHMVAVTHQCLLHAAA